MARPVTITTEQIVEAAHAVFMEQGYRNATTARIAKRAGISEGSLFKRFKDKPELFAAAMAFPPASYHDLLSSGVGQGDLRENLVDLATRMLIFFEGMLPPSMMTWANRGARGRSGTAHPSARALQQLSGFFAKEMKLGRVRKGDPETVARMFSGPMMHFCLLRLLFDDQRLPRERFARDLVDHLWTGLAP
jgi:AcrR family transcriptional regulator